MTTFENIATKQGWNEGAKLHVLRRFIEKKGDWSELLAWANTVAAAENGEADPTWPADPGERKWLNDLTPTAILNNAHRFYDYMTETGMANESDLREAAFAKAAEALGLDYDVFYDAWLNQMPVGPAVKRRVAARLATKA